MGHKPLSYYTYNPWIMSKYEIKLHEHHVISFSGNSGENYELGKIRA